jgi:glutamate-ammonia-ligase adenylyltransferase
VEHCLQLRQGQQTHRLPEDRRELTILQRAVAGYLPAGERVDDVVSAIQSRMASVAEIYSRIVYQEQSGAQDVAVDGEFRLRAGADAETPQRSDQKMLRQLAADAPAIYQLTQRGDFDPETRKNLLRFLSAAFTSSERYGILLRQADSLSRAVRLFATSDYLTDVLVRHVEEIVTLAHFPREAAGSDTGQLFSDRFRHRSFLSDPVFAHIVASDAAYEEKLSLLRKHYRRREFASGARDVIAGRDVYESLASTTAAAEDAIAAAFRIAGSPRGLAVLALGRLGTREFDLLSDVDLLFVADEHQDRRVLTKAVELIMHGLAAYTQQGMLFPVDARLRPHGTEGELVVTTKQLHTYFEQEAHAWEALTYTKLRPIVGGRQISSQAMAATKTLFARFAARPEFKREIEEMRSKLEDSSEENFKSSAGGIYDIDFVTAYLLIAHEVRHKNGNIRDRLWRCAATGHLAKEDAAILDHAAEFMRTLEHVVRLVTGRARRSLPGRGHARERVQRLTSAILRRSFSQNLEGELHNTLEQVRSVYMRVLG